MTSGILGLLLVFIIIAIYFLPTATAIDRKHHNRNAIIILNLLLGWTVVGWIVALVWAATNPAARQGAARACLKCGTLLAGQERFCGHCGAPMP